MRLIILLVLLPYLSGMQAQSADNRMSEEDVKFQEKFIAAKGYLIMERPDKCEKSLLELYKSDRTNPSIALELLELYQQLDDPYNQLKYGKIAADNADGNPYILKKYAEASLKNSNFEEAVLTYIKLVNIDAQSEEYTDKLASAYVELGDYKKAISSYNKLERLIGFKQDISRRKFELYDLQGKHEKATAELEMLSEAQPFNVGALHLLAQYYDKYNNHDKAIESYKKILDIDVNDTKANIALMGDSAVPDNDNNYIRALSPIIENKDLSIDNKVLELIPYIKKYNNTLDQELGNALLDIAHRLVATHPKEAKSHAFLGDILYLNENTHDAIKSYEKTIKLNDNIYSVWKQLMDAYVQENEYSKLLKLSHNAVDYFPNKASAFYYYGIALRKSKNYTDAIDYLNDGVLISGKDNHMKSDLLAELSLAYLYANNITKANSSIQKSLELSQKLNPKALEAMGDILFKSNNKDEAVKYWKKAKSNGSRNKLINNKISEKRIFD